MNRPILAVDDDPDILELVSVILDQAGYQVITAVNGADALARLEGARPSLLILDVMMPDMSGFSLLRMVRARPETSDVPVLMLTARNFQTDISDAYRLGADMFLCKPFEPEELLQFVERFLPADRSPADTPA